MALQGLNVLADIYRRQQQSDDDIGGSVWLRSPVATAVPCRIGSTRSPMALRIQGIESTNIYDCNIQLPGVAILDIRIDDILVPQNGQFKNWDFAITAVQEDSIADSPNDSRRHKSLSLRHVDRAQQAQ